VFASGPYPNPPKEIRSGNGKVYMHWAFHRNERACGTFGAQPYILDNAGAGDIPDAHAEIQLGAGGGSHAEHEHTRALVRNDGSGNLSGGAGEAGVEELRRGGDGSGASLIPEGPARPAPKPADADPVGAGDTSGPTEGPRGPVVAPGGRGPGGFGSGTAGVPGQGFPGGTGSAGSGNVGAGGVPTGRGGPGAAQAPKPAPKPASMPLSGRRASNSTGAAGGSDANETTAPEPAEAAVDPIATEIAKNWARAFTKGEITTMVNRTALPFHSGSRVAAKSKQELEGLLEAMAEEVEGKSAKVEGTYSAAGMRKKFGSVPAGVEEGEGRLYSVVEIGGDSVILMLEKRFGSWRIIGITR
jgi:hypothetical protein